MEQWTSTLDTRCAAAFGTLGAIIRLETTIIERTAEKVTRFHLTRTSPCGQYATIRIRNEAKAGKLPAAHPYLTLQHALENRHVLLQLQKAGQPCDLRPVPGSPGVFRYVPGTTGLPGVRGAGEVVKLDSLALTAALGTAGFPLLALEGTPGHHSYHLPRWGPNDIGGERLDAVALLTAWNADKNSIPWDTTFGKAARVIHNHQRLLDAIRNNVPNVLLMKPRSQRAATIRLDATPAAFDKVKHHFDAP